MQDERIGTVGYWLGSKWMTDHDDDDAHERRMDDCVTAADEFFKAAFRDGATFTDYFAECFRLGVQSVLDVELWGREIRRHSNPEA